MDQIKIGKFIADMRKKQGLTQKQLADQLNVTDKTISKWETGHRLPDASLLLELSSALKVNINELLSGEEFLPKDFSAEEYIEKTESNIVGLVNDLNEAGEKSRSERIGVIVGLLLLGTMFLYLFAASLWPGRVMDILDFPTLFCLLGLKLITLSISGWSHNYLTAWKAVLFKKGLPREELESAIQAVKYAGALALSLGSFITSLSLFSLLNHIDNPGAIYAALAQIVLASLYTAIAETIYAILIFRIKRMI